MQRRLERRQPVVLEHVEQRLGHERVSWSVGRHSEIRSDELREEREQPAGKGRSKEEPEASSFVALVGRSEIRNKERTVLPALSRPRNRILAFLFMSPAMRRRGRRGQRALRRGEEARAGTGPAWCTSESERGRRTELGEHVEEPVLVAAAEGRSALASIATASLLSDVRG